QQVRKVRGLMQWRNRFEVPDNIAFPAGFKVRGASREPTAVLQPAGQLCPYRGQVEPAGSASRAETPTNQSHPVVTCSAYGRRRGTHAQISSSKEGRQDCVAH